MSALRKSLLIKGNTIYLPLNPLYIKLALNLIYIIASNINAYKYLLLVAPIRLHLITNSRYSITIT